MFQLELTMNKRGIFHMHCNGGIYGRCGIAILQKRGIFFSADALIALAIIMIVILVAFPIFEYSVTKTNVHQDSIVILSSLKVGEFASNSLTVNTWIADGIINDTEKLLIEQLGIFSAENPAYAQALAQEILNMINTTENMGIWYNNTLLASKNTTPYELAEKVDVARQTISGIGGLGEGSATGFSARAYLSGSSQNIYTYFGGYVGEGNISFFLRDTHRPSSIEMELVINNDFELFVNNVSGGTFSKSPSESEPVRYNLTIDSASPLIFAFFETNGYYFIPSEPEYDYDLIELRGKNLHISGGFIKVTYRKRDVAYDQTRYYFPGINGVINLYDGFYIPGNVTNMSVFLHMDSNYSTFLIIGNQTVYKNITDGEETIIINNTQLLSYGVNYSQSSKKTVPLRLGLENFSSSGGNNAKVDVFSVTDISFSMRDQPLLDAKSANHELIDVILNVSGNRVGLATYSTWAYTNYSYNLTNNSAALHNRVNVFSAIDRTCICCGIMKAISCYDANIFMDNFNGQIVNTDPYGWFIQGKGGDVNITDKSLEGDRAMVIDGNATVINSTHIFAAQDTPLHFQFLVNHTSGTGWAKIEIKDSYNNTYAGISMHDNYFWNGITSFAPYSPGKVYKVRIDLTPGKDRYNVSINDTWYGRNLPVQTAGLKNAGQIRFSTSTANIRYIIDDVKIWVNKTSCDGSGNSGRHMIVMSDGSPNELCGVSTKRDSGWDAINASCKAKNIYNITVHAIAFGNGANQSLMKNISACGGGNYSYADGSNIVNVYQQLASNIIKVTYSEQTLNVTGNVSSILYPDSYVEFNYVKETDPSGLRLTLERGFYNNYSGNFSLPADSSIVETKVISYSGPKWTDKVRINGNKTYDLAAYGGDYTKLGDPYALNIPNSLVKINNLNNTVNLTVGISPTNSTYGSIFNKIIYTISKSFLAYSNVTSTLEGCEWTIEFEDGTNITVGDSTLDACSYKSTNSPPGYGVYDGDDAAQAAVYNLLRAMDLNLNGRVDIKFEEQDLQITLDQLSGIPFIKSEEIQIRVWR